MDDFDDLVRALSRARIGGTFNFLSDADQLTDKEKPEGAAIRRANLLHYLRGRSEAPVVAVGEAAGYRGARWSGIAFTSERFLATQGEPYANSSLHKKGWAERSSTIVHRVLGEAEGKVLLWNVVPTHPHRDGNPLSNRTPTPREVEEGAEWASHIVRLVQPEVVIAIGKQARLGLTNGGCTDVLCVRHPAWGGGPDFTQQMREILGSL